MEQYQNEKLGGIIVQKKTCRKQSSTRQNQNYPKGKDKNKGQN